MDQTTLVDEQIADGKRLLDRLGEAGFPVTAAGWVRETENGRWYLYVVSPVVKDQGIGTAYRRIQPVIRQMPQPFSIGPFQVRAFEPHGRVAEAMLELRHRNAGRSPLRYGGTQLGGIEIEAAYLYPRVAEATQPDGQVTDVR
jgi:hypothetical protein